MRRAAPGALSHAAIALTSLALAPTLAAQERCPAPVGTHVAAGSLGDEQRRLALLLGCPSADPSLVRSASRDGAAPDGSQVRALLPEIRAVFNSQLPLGGNDAALWAGRGVSVLARAGAAASWGPLRIVALPEVVHSQNRAFPTIAGRDTSRSAYASPWHVGTYSADLPLRFGDRPITSVTAGQSSVSLVFGRLTAGAATENAWWGPGVYDAIVMSNNAEGFPHLFVGSSRALRTPLGHVDARLVSGVLTESVFFDRSPSNDHRAISGVVATLRPAFDTTLTIGVERTVVAAIAGRRRFVGHALDALVRNPSPGDSSATTEPLIGAFFRWGRGARASGFEVYGEWTRRDVPRSLRELVLAPHRTQAYVLGVGHAASVSGRASLVTRLELANLEQSRAFADDRTPIDYYASARVAHGYTHRGQTIGASVGPGGSAQTGSVGLVMPALQVELFGRRARVENDALYREPVANQRRHDVSLTAGVRALVERAGYLMRAELGFTDRVNYLFQNGSANIGGVRTVDLHNLRLALDLSPTRRAR